MIFCNKKDLGRYLGLHPNLDTALRYLMREDLGALPLGKTLIDGDAVFVNRSDYETVGESVFEGHAAYADIHVVLEGEEAIGVSDVSVLKEIERKPEKDFIGFAGEFQSVNVLRPGDALIVFPEDAHSPKRISGDAPCRVKKVVFKVLLACEPSCVQAS